MKSRSIMKLAMAVAAAVAVSSCNKSAPTDRDTASSADERKNVAALTALADQGDATGEGVAQDDAAALKRAGLVALTAMADQGNVSAQYNLGLMYAQGQGVPQDDAAAASWLRKAADQGYASAQFNLGVMYATGQGVAQDDVQSYKWFNVSAAGTEDAEMREMATEGRDIVALRMTPAQIAEAQRLASEWKKK